MTKHIWRCRWLMFLSLVLLPGVVASADPITGMTYTYDLSTSDPATGQYTLPHPEMAANDTDDASDPAAITSNGVLVDGELGDAETLTGAGCCAYDNTTFAGFGNLGYGGAPQPKVDIDLGGRYVVDSYTLHYLVEDQAGVYSPQPADWLGEHFYALSVSGSADGENFSLLGSTDDFRPLYGPGGDVGTDVREVRSATVPLGGVEATHLSFEVHTPWTWIFLSEFVVDGTAVGGLPGDYNQNNVVDAADYTVWRDLLGTAGPLPREGVSPGVIDVEDYNFWKAHFGDAAGPGAASGELSIAAAQTVPEPAAIFLFVLGWTSMLAGRRLYGHA